MRTFICVSAAVAWMVAIASAEDVRFAEKPAIAKGKDGGSSVSFAVSAATDVEVAILDRSGGMVRHLAAVRQLIGPRKYRSFNGTSAATPYVAGIVALMMQKKPTITAVEIKQLLATHATKDISKLLPKDRQVGWGNGKLDAAAVVRTMQAIKD